MCTNSRLRLIAFALLASPILAPRAGEIYKSVDAEGHVVYSDQFDPSAGVHTRVEIQSSDPGAEDEVQATEAPPPLPDEEQTACPDEGYLWTPGHWARNAAAFYWVPGAWVEPPQVDVLWTPGYWEFVRAVYVFHRGYWAGHIGYYGGINYGFGYFGVGFSGGRWSNHSFAYNRAVSHVDERVIHNLYNESVNTARMNRVSYNGPGGSTSLITAQERAVERERHFSAPAPGLGHHMPVSVYQSAPTRESAAFSAAGRSEPRATASPFVARQHEPAHAPGARSHIEASTARPGKPVPMHRAVRKVATDLRPTKN
jgi:hypothetical protein